MLSPTGEILIMARQSGSALTGLAKLADERRDMDAREAQLRAEAAIEIGTALLGVGAEKIELKLLEKVVKKVGELGATEAMKRLDAKAA
jgi:hypothetical protein